MATDPAPPNDVGGQRRFGRVDPSQVSRPSWYPQLVAINSLLLLARIYTMDDFRDAVERLDPAVYQSLSYYERRLAAVEALVIRHQHSHTGGHGVPGRSLTTWAPPAPPEPRFNAGSSVRVRTDVGSGHTRVPSYVWGAAGYVESIAGARVAPEERAKHAPGARAQWVYRVAFHSTDLWPDAATGDRVIVEIYEHQLQQAPATGAAEPPLPTQGSRA